ncbi:MAG: DNA polymerase III subunit alpha [Betaproteobacteria bacterium CG2_30_59_46]|nr:MAG: DNA polymerase III subunit alpha [Betaproteobacteria bacterium CG2_30_59_46]PIQ12865.1 MAG: DNA polymerase III subunit alpha [Hydrogenophilales bacterium CG18_big_fil_WC_8_21_14_2_50_58_12]PIY00293.1 MAG: DNA polymerase III subunit alpha [Hydrogenophilales bacterium CG_4_10_14_3_um_filter_58_23]PJB06848.1 MAG: DNA polymerase III subunit alpha [Hydrogenophilales bacterium CG_4_9_14_3_um_filter_59_35]
MSDPSFIHLRLHSEYSIVDGIVRIDDAIASAVADRMPALALTDLSNLFGMLKFYKAARGKGIKPIVGCDVWISNDANRDQPHRLLLLCRNRQGYLRLCDLLTRAYRSNQHRGRAEVRREWFADGGSDGLIALSGAHFGDVGQALLQAKRAQARELAVEWQRLFPGAFYLELQRTGLPQADAHVRLALSLASELLLPVAATHPIEFLAPDDYKAHEARVCISEGYMLADKRRPRVFTEQQYFKTQAEMAELFADIPEALANSVEIAKRCNLSIELGKSKLPLFPVPKGMSLDDTLVQRAEEGLAERMKELYPDEAKRAEQYPTYTDRLKFEIGTITQMGFPGYFLIVADFINWAKHNGVPVGPGRGSGAGSLVAYSLGITDLDPLRYALLFERFLNPERVSMPDFDVDFCQDNRWRVIEYVREKYGADAVSQIATFGTMAAKAVVRDVGRVLDLPYNFCDQLSKLIPAAPGKQYSLDEALEMEPQLKERYDSEEEVRELFILARKLEGLTRNVGMHAGGVLIAPGKLTDFCPLYLAPNADNAVSQFDKHDVEAVGLVKFDFLGLRNLTIIDLALKYIKKLDPSFDQPLDTQHFDDPAVYEVLKKANTTAVFQLESEGMKKLLVKLQPDRFEDIIAVLALYRPGPLGSGMVDDFILRKKGKQSIDYFHPDLQASLAPTYGVIVYQEQVMQISQIIGGYTLGGADLLRRAMGHKEQKEMDEQRGLFVAGALQKGHPEKLAHSLFDLMAKFAEYGFNKSHTAAYAVISYQTAWLKAHHTSAFMAATLSSELDNTDQLKVFYEDTLANKVKVLAPDVNVSGYRFEPVSRADIRYGLGAIKGTGEAAINVIVAAREKDGPFTSLFDFCRRVDKRTVNRRVIESLVRAGAFDTLNDNRASLLASVGVAMEAAEQENRDIFQNSLFDAMEDGGAESRPDAMVDAPRWPMIEQLTNEKKALGFYFSGHPYDAYRSELAGFIKTRLSDIVPQQQPVWLAGVIYAIRTQMTKRGKMAIISLEDGIARIEVSVFSELFDAHKDILKEDHTLILEGKISKDDYSGGFRVIAESLLDLAGARTRFAKLLRLSFPASGNPGQLKAEAHAESYAPQGDSDPLWAEAHAESYAGKLQEILSGYRDEAGCRVRIGYGNVTASCELELGEGWRVNLKDNLLVSLADCIGSENFIIQY